MRMAKLVRRLRIGQVSTAVLKPLQVSLMFFEETFVIELLEDELEKLKSVEDPGGRVRFGGGKTVDVLQCSFAVRFRCLC